MSSDTHPNSPPDYTPRGAVAGPDVMRAASDLADAFGTVVVRVGDLIEGARAPGQPLDILTRLTRKAPLGCLLAAFVLGVVTTRRR